jgi:hypothetical protein
MKLIPLIIALGKALLFLVTLFFLSLVAIQYPVAFWSFVVILCITLLFYEESK